MNKLIKDTMAISIKKEGEKINPQELAAILVQYNGMIKYVLKELVGIDVDVTMDEYDNKTGKIVFGVKDNKGATDATVVQS